MFWWLIGIFFKSLWGVYRKKALEGGKGLHPFSFLLVGSISWALIGLCFYFLKYEGNYNFPPNVVLLSFLAIFFRFAGSQLVQDIYKKEKLSVITPYENLSQILSILFAFFLFWGVSVVTFILSIIIVVITFAFSVDIKHLKFPKFFGRFFLAQFLSSAYNIAVWYILKTISFSEYFTIEAVVAFVLLFWITLFSSRIYQTITQTKTFYIHRSTTALLGDIGFIIGIFITDKFWLILNIILSFLYIAFTLFLSFIFFKDIPTKKSILFTTIVTILVGLALYLK